MVPLYSLSVGYGFVHDSKLWSIDAIASDGKYECSCCDSGSIRECTFDPEIIVRAYTDF